MRPPQAADGELAPFPEPEGSQPLEVEVLEAPPNDRTVDVDLATGRVEQTWRHSFGGRRRFLRDGLEIEAIGSDTYTIVEGEPLSAAARCEWTIELRRGDWQTRVETSSLLTADADSFLVTNSVDAYEGNTRVFASSRAFSVPRDLM